MELYHPLPIEDNPPSSSSPAPPSLPSLTNLPSLTMIAAALRPQPLLKLHIVDAYLAYRAGPSVRTAVQKVCAEYGISRSTLFKYQRQFRENKRRDVRDPGAPDSAFVRGAPSDNALSRQTRANPDYAARQREFGRRYLATTDTYHRSLRQCLCQILAAARKRDAKAAASHSSSSSSSGSSEEDLTTNHAADDRLTIEFLDGLWTRQKGVCALTGLAMSFQGPPHAPCTVSLVRVDPRRNLAPDNVMLVCYFASCLKRNFTLAQAREVLRAAKEFHNHGTVEMWDPAKMPPRYKVYAQLGRCLANSVRRACTRRKLLNMKNAHNLSLENLVHAYERQNGRCALTGLVLTPAFHSPDIAIEPRSISVDRIDSNRGYTADNVQLAGFAINLAKSDYPEDYFAELLRQMPLCSPG